MEIDFANSRQNLAAWELPNEMRAAKSPNSARRGQYCPLLRALELQRPGHSVPRRHLIPSARRAENECTLFRAKSILAGFWGWSPNLEIDEAGGWGRGRTAAPAVV
jgi:hypothetical protein